MERRSRWSTTSSLCTPRPPLRPNPSRCRLVSGRRLQDRAQSHAPRPQAGVHSHPGKCRPQPLCQLVRQSPCLTLLADPTLRRPLRPSPPWSRRNCHRPHRPMPTRHLPLFHPRRQCPRPHQRPRPRSLRHRPRSHPRRRHPPVQRLRPGRGSRATGRPTSRSRRFRRDACNRNSRTTGFGTVNDRHGASPCIPGHSPAYGKKCVAVP
jgi:hypothetical protein